MRVRSLAGVSARALLILLIFTVCGRCVPAQKSAFWGGLEPGPYAVGFKIIYRYDYSRTWKIKSQLDAREQPGEGARPVRISVWYPAKNLARAARMTYRDYAYPATPDPRFAELNNLLARREAGLLRHVILGEAASNALMSSRVGASLNAPARPGAFPLVAYSSGLNESWQHVNFVLCEYLASHGYVVMTVPQLGPNSLRLNLGINPASLETQVRDLEFAVGAMHDFPNVDRDRLAVVGHSMGGVAALVLQMRNSYVGAVVGLDASYGSRSLAKTLTDSAYYNPERMRAPLLDLRRSNDELDLSGVEAFTYSDRFFLELAGLAHADFTSFPEIALRFPTDMEGRTPQTAARGYEVACRYVLNFLDAYLKGSAAGMKFVKNRPEANGIPQGVVRHTFHQGAKPRPTAEEFVLIILRDGVRSAAREHSELNDESLVNTLGYRFLELQRSAQAVELFELNVRNHPASANAYDSLADAYWQGGNKTLAAQAYEKVLALLPADTSLGEEQKANLRRTAEDRLRALRR